MYSLRLSLDISYVDLHTSSCFFFTIFGQCINVLNYKYKLGDDHLTFEGGGGVSDLWSARFFCLATWWVGYFFTAVQEFFSITFVLHEIFFFRQALAGNFFFKITHPLPQELNGRPLSSQWSL